MARKRHKVLKVSNLGKLPTINYQALVELQKDFKKPILDSDLKKLKNSLVKHGIFVPRFVWKNKELFYIMDGHQTKTALESLERDGWTIPEIPYVQVEALDKIDAAKKLLQINSQYAKINPDSNWLKDLPDLSQVLSEICISDLDGILPVEKLEDRSFELEEKELVPFRWVHVLLSIPVQDYYKVQSFIEEVEDFPFVKILKSSN